MRQPRPPRRPEVLEWIAANTRKLRTTRGWTQENLAQAMGVDPRYLQKIERASLNFGVTILAVIADALNVKPSRLLRPAKLDLPARGRPAQRRPGRKP